MKPLKYTGAFAGTVVLSFVLFSIAYSARTDRFEEVLESLSDEVVKKELQTFKTGGIEKRINILGYNPVEIVNYALTFKGTPYKMGGSCKKGTDCSGLVMAVHEHFNIKLPHSANEQARFGLIISRIDDLDVGDLVFFYKTYAAKEPITHVGIYIGNGDFIHSSSSGVVVAKVEDPYYWRERFLFGTRLY